MTVISHLSCTTALLGAFQADAFNGVLRVPVAKPGSQNFYYLFDLKLGQNVPTLQNFVRNLFRVSNDFSSWHRRWTGEFSYSAPIPGAEGHWSVEIEEDGAVFHASSDWIRHQSR